MDKFKIDCDGVVCTNAGGNKVISGDSIEAHLLVAILEKIEEIRWRIIDVEDAFLKNNHSG
jgi:hypothetical protein